MAEENLNNLTEEELRMLRHEAFVSQILKQRASPEKVGSIKPRWQRFLESTGGTAMVTVIIGGIFGAVISGIIQAGLKERDYQQTRLKSLGDQALISHKEYLDKQQDIVKRIYEKIGTSISAAEDMITITRREYNPTSKQGVEKERQKKFNDSVIENFNLKDKEWRSERDVLGLLVNYYHPKQSEVNAAWNKVKHAVTTQMTCASDWYSTNPIVESTESACKDERELLSQALEGLSKSLENSRTYSWEGWRDPKSLLPNSSVQND